MASDLNIRIGAELTEIKAALAGLQKDLSGVDKTAKNAGGNALQGLQSGADAAITAIQGLAAAFAGLQAVSKFIDLADQAANLSARLRLATNSVAEFNQALVGVQQVANETRQPLADVANLYARLAQNLTDPPEKLLALTTTISKAVTLSGASAEAAQAAIVQLGQGLAAGQLRGEELNSVLEQTPRLARAIEEGLGLARGALRQFAAEGKITAEAVKQALEGQAEVINKEFAQLPTTISQSFTLLNNAALQYVGVLDEANGISGTFAGSIKLLADNINLLVAAITALVTIPLAAAIGRAAAAIGAAVVAMRAAAGAATRGAQLLGVAMSVLGGKVGLILTVLGLGASAFMAFAGRTEEANKKAAKSTEESTEEIIKSIQRRIEKLDEERRAIEATPPVPVSEVQQAQQELLVREKQYQDALAALRNASTAQERERLQLIAQSVGAAYGKVFAEVAKLNEAINLRDGARQVQAAAKYMADLATDTEKLNKELAQAKKDLGSQFSPEIERRIRAKYSKGGDQIVKAGLDSQEKLVKDASDRQLAILQEQFDQGLLSAEAYYDGRTQIELDALDRIIEIERRRARLGGADGVKAKTEIQILENEKTDIIRKAAVDRNKAIAALTIERAQSEKRVLDAANETTIAQLDALKERGLISIGAYYDQRAQLELASVERSLEIERLRAQGNGKDRIAALAEIRVLEERQRQISERNARERAEAERRLNDEITQARIQQLQLEGKTAEAERIRLETQFRDLLNRLKQEGNEAGISLIKGLINSSVARAEFDQIQAQFNRVVEQLQQRQQSINAQRDTGVISGETASGQIAAERQTAIDQLTILNTKLQELAANSRDPSIVQGAQAAAAALTQLGIDGAVGIDKAVISLRAGLAQMQQAFAENAVNAGVDALTGFFNDIATGSKSAGDALRDFVRGFALSMAQIAARALATFIVLQALDAVYPGLGRTTAAVMGATVNHGGGMAGTGPRRMVDPLLFAAAPRYHSGGMVGLKPGEVPAILQTGEEVLSRTDPRNQINGGSGTNVRIINSIDPELAADYFNSPQGEQVFVNLISRNSATLRNVLA